LQLALLKDDHYLTSDQGIHKNLVTIRSGTGIFVSPEGILLPGFSEWFYRRGNGVAERHNVYITGSLSHYPEGKAVRKFLRRFEIRNNVNFTRVRYLMAVGILFMNL
jgi:hypothetical protein